MFDIVGFDSTWKVPYFAIQINYAAGPLLGQGPLNCLLVGQPGTGGNIANNTEIRQVFQQSDIDTACQPGSQLSRMGKKAFSALPSAAGAGIFIAACSPASGAKATVTLTITGSWTVGGTMFVDVGGVTIAQSIGATDIANTVAANLANAINGNPDLPMQATAAGNVVTLTCIDPGLKGNSEIIVQDLSQAPSGFACAIAGSSTLHTSTNGVTMVAAGATPGSGVESLTSILGVMVARRWARIGVGPNDATNAAAVKAFIKQQLAPLVQKYNMAIFGHNGTLASATSLAQTTLNDPNCQVVAARNCTIHPSEIAAGMAAHRATVENGTPIYDYDGFDCSAWIPSTRTVFLSSDPWLDSEANTLLNAGVTPIRTGLDGGPMRVVRAITTYCQLNGGPDTRCIDIGDAVMAAYVAIALNNAYTTFRQSNPYVQDNPQPQQNDPPSGTAYPNLWKGVVTKLLSDLGPGLPGGPPGAGWLVDTWSGSSPKYPIGVSFNAASQRIQSSVNIVAARLQHGLAMTVNQTGPG